MHSEASRERRPPEVPHAVPRSPRRAVLSFGHPGRPVLDDLDRRLLDEHQRGFPIRETPFAEIARRLGCEADDVIRRLAALRHRGVVSRVGPVFTPGRIGASTLVAMAVPPARLATVAECVNRYRAVNHNYEREHALNLWFVLTAADAVELDETLADIRRRTGLDVLDLRLERAYHIDLGFPLWRRSPVGSRARPTGASATPAARAAPALRLDALDLRLIGAIQDGLPLVVRPYAAVGERIGRSETRVMERIERLMRGGVIKRMGVVVRHHELGFRANAMVVFDAPDDRVDVLGERLARLAPVTLCYRRTRRPPVWSRNLYCMLHGRDRAEVTGWVETLLPDAVDGLEPVVLFSRRRFRQRGARYAPAQRVSPECAVPESVLPECTVPERVLPEHPVPEHVSPEHPVPDAAVMESEAAVHE